MIETAVNLDTKSINDSTIDKSSKDTKHTNDDNQPTLTLKNQIQNGQLFGPFSDPIQWLAIRHSPCKSNSPKEISANLDNDLFNLFASIQMANSIDEQNMEIIVNKNKFYFRAMQDIELKDVDDDDDDKNSEIKKNDKEQPLFAWFSSELSGKLPTPGVSLINGSKRYFCTKCNQVFVYPNSAILHILFACTKQQSNSISNSISNNNISNSISNNSNGTNSDSCNNSNNNVQSNLSNNIEFINKLTAASTIASSLDNDASNISNNNNPTTAKSQLSLNNEISLSNSKILKNLEAKLCKQFNSNISTSDTIQSSGSKPKTKKRSSFDIDSLVNNSGGGGGGHSSDHVKKQKSSKNDKSSSSFKASTSTNATASANNTANLNNSTLINSLNSPLVSASNNYLNPFSFLDPTASSSSLASSAFHKFDNNNLIKSSLTDSNSLLNAAAMFSNPNFTNPYDLSTLYAQHQRSILQSLYLQSATGNPLLASQNLTNINLQNSLASSLFAAGLGGANNLNSFSGLDLFNLPSSTSSAAVAAAAAAAAQSNSQSNSQQSAASQQQIEKSKKSKKSKDSKTSQQNLISNNDNQNTFNKLTQQLQSQSSQSIPPSYLQFLPPSLAALSYPQSNWCAKCSIGFRMTSDLVYHMRSQHKDSGTSGVSSSGNSTNGQSSSPIKRKREENKLFCTICGEGFRERHHLTRHMISH